MPHVVLSILVNKYQLWCQILFFSVFSEIFYFDLNIFVRSSFYVITSFEVFPSSVNRWGLECRCSNDCYNAIQKRFKIQIFSKFKMPILCCLYFWCANFYIFYIKKGPWGKIYKPGLWSLNPYFSFFFTGNYLSFKNLFHSQLRLTLLTEEGNTSNEVIT